MTQMANTDGLDKRRDEILWLVRQNAMQLFLEGCRVLAQIPIRNLTHKGRRDAALDCPGEIKAHLVDMARKIHREASCEFKEKIECSSETLPLVTNVVRAI
jgi:hypothetical protein